MATESRLAKFVRGLVKFVFIVCYAAFMWASIHKVAYFFGNFEADSGSMIGSYALACAFDITALVTTIGVMFFRKSMPRRIQIVVWIFIIGIAAFSYFVNWEYDAHFQNVALTLQPTGATMPVYDTHQHLHYVPVMRQNTTLLYANPLLASGFTIFSLIYSVIAEFFGTKPPTIQELQARKQYLEETADVLENIRQLEGKHKGKGLIQIAKEKVIEVEDAWKEVQQHQETDRKPEDHTEETSEETSEETVQETDRIAPGNSEETPVIQARKPDLSDDGNLVAMHWEKALSWLSTSGSTVSLKTVIDTTNITGKLLRNRVETKQIRATRNKEIVYKDSLIAWMITEAIPRETVKVLRLKLVGNRENASEETDRQLEGNHQEIDSLLERNTDGIPAITSEETSEETDGKAPGNEEDKLNLAISILSESPEITEEVLAERLGLLRPLSARFWKIKAQEIIASNHHVASH